MGKIIHLANKFEGILGMPFEFAQLPHIDIDDIRKKGIVRSNSTLDKEVEYPPEALNKVKQTIEEFVTRQVNNAQVVLHRAEAEADAGLERIEEKDIVDRFARQQPKLNEFSIELRKKEIEMADDTYLSRAKDYSDFRQTHQRQYSAYNFDKPIWSLGVGGLLATLFIIEATMNAFLFKDIAGLITAYSLAFSQSFVNIGGCFLIGKLLMGPIAAVPETKRKIYFAVPLIIHLIFTIWINLVLGLYRAININFSEQVEEAPEMANAALQPWGYLEFLDTPSAIVVFVGLVLAAIAYLKGVYSDDPYPGYGKLARATMEEQKITRTFVENLNQEKVHLHKEFEAAKSKVASDIQSGLNRWSNAINLMEKISVDYSAMIANINNIWESSIEAYEGGLGKSLPVDLKSPLFDQTRADPNIVFIDVSHYFQTDEERLAHREALKTKTNAGRDVVENNIRVNIEARLMQISEIEGYYPSRARFP